MNKVYGELAMTLPIDSFSPESILMTSKSPGRVEPTVMLSVRTAYIHDVISYQFIAIHYPYQVTAMHAYTISFAKKDILVELLRSSVVVYLYSESLFQPLVVP